MLSHSSFLRTCVFHVLGILPVCMCVHRPHLWMLLEEGIRSPELELQWLWPTLQVVGIEPRPLEEQHLTQGPVHAKHMLPS